MKMPEGGKMGYVYILREGLAYAAWLSVHGFGEQQRLAAEFVEYIRGRGRGRGCLQEGQGDRGRGEVEGLSKAGGL